MSLTYKIGDATRPEGEGTKLILHVCNDRGAWGRGFVTALSRRWAAPEARYREWHRTRGGFLPLGQVQLVRVEPDILVANLIGQCGIRSRLNPAPIRYDALRQGLRRIALAAGPLNASIHMPRIGCGLAGGKWESIEPILQEELGGFAITVYDLPRGTIPNG